MNKYVKYPKTNHFPWSECITSDDKFLTIDQVMEYFSGKDVVVSLKIDGENTNCYSDYIHARSIDGRDHPSRSWVKNLHSQIKYNIPKDWRVCGENVFAKHSIHYKNLTTYFYVFAIFNEKNICLSWDETKEWCKLLGLETVPTIYEGKFDIDRVKACYPNNPMFEGSEQEGYVMRLREQIPFLKFRQSFAKFVRKNHVTSAQNWMNSEVVRNELKVV